MSAIKDLYRLDDDAFNEAFDRAVVNIHLRKQESGSRTFVLCGCEPYVGTTTISINLAIAMATSGWKTVLIDSDMRKGLGSKRLSEDGGGNLAAYLEGRACQEDILFPTNHENLTYIPGGWPSSSTIQLLCAPAMPELISRLKAEFDYVILDAPAPLAAVDTCILAAQSNGIVLVARWEHTTIEQIENTRNELKVSGAPILGVILNGVDRDSYIHGKGRNAGNTGRKRRNGQPTNWKRSAGTYAVPAEGKRGRDGR